MGTALLEPETADIRSVRLQEEVETSWQDVKHEPLAERERWLNTQEAIVALAASKRTDILRGIAAKRDRLQLDVPSGAWFLNSFHDGQAFPPGGFTIVKDRHGKERRRLALMKLSREKTRYGDGGPSRRFISPVAVDLEDDTDSLSYNEAKFGLALLWPASPSAVAIQRIESMRGREADAVELRRIDVRNRAGKRSPKSAEIVHEPVIQSVDEIATFGV